MRSPSAIMVLARINAWGGLLQDGEQQLQMFLTKLGAEERKNITVNQQCVF